MILLGLLMMAGGVDENAIDKAIAGSVAGWNAGDVERFMEVYS